jgi:hypothetical protein
MTWRRTIANITPAGFGISRIKKSRVKSALFDLSHLSAGGEAFFQRTVQDVLLFP